MPIVFGFANHRKNCLEKELSKFSNESKQLGAKSLGVFGDYPLGKVSPDTPLDLIIIQETEKNCDRFCADRRGLFCLCISLCTN